MASYTDKEMVLFTQIAYADLKEAYDYMVATTGGTSFTIAALRQTAERLGCLSADTISRLEGLNSEQLNWEIMGIRDTNSTTGFYGCIIKTGENEAVCAFRGSEDMNSLDNVIHDWTSADIGLLNSTCTEQQAEARAFMEEFSDILQGYDLTMTGHSLGGNLAEYATIISEDYGLDDNISCCKSLDGPGFSDEFIAEYSEKIKKMAGVIHHKRWSFVGALLNDLPGADYEFLQVDESKKGIDNLSRHDTKYLKFEKDSFLPGEQDDFSKSISQITRDIDHLPKFMGDILANVVTIGWIAVQWARETFLDKDGNLKTGFRILLDAAIGVAAIFIISNPLIILPLAALAIKIAIVVVLAVVAIAAIKVVIDAVINVVKQVVKKIGEVLKWVADAVKNVIESIKNFCEGVANWFKEHFDSGYRYAMDNPQIELNTATMYQHAGTLRSLSARAKTLDGDMNSLYFQLGINWDTIANLGRLLKANILLDYAHRLDDCAGYLEETARDFENVENKISGYFK